MDKIFDLIMKEARSRPGEDLVLKILKVSTELDNRLFVAIRDLQTAKHKEGTHES